MISTAEIVESLIQSSPLLEDGLARGIISYSSLARELRPQIEKKLMKDITRGAIVMALKRVSKNLKLKSKNIQQSIDLQGLTVRSNLIEFTYFNSDTIAKKHKEIFNMTEKRTDIFWNLSQGVRETMILAGKEIESAIEKIFKEEKRIAKIENLSSITILLSKEATFIPGVYYSILKLLAWNTINFIDIISTHTELTIIFSNQDIDKAFSVLRNYQNTLDITLIT